MQLIVAPEVVPLRLGLLPGGFNPPTRAHLALAESALGLVDSVLLVMPRTFPHKTWEGAPLSDRIEMLRRVTSGRVRLGAAVSEGGLFIEIAKEARQLYPAAELHVLCGRDAAERIVAWDYGEPGAIDAMLRDFGLLVAPRQGSYEPPPRLAHAVRSLPLASYDECASTHVRAAAQEWESLVPDEIRDFVRQLYGLP